MKKLTVEDFIKRASEIHNHKYDYSNSVYNGKDVLLKIICPIHGEFEQSPNNHYKHGCSKCGHIITDTFRINKGKNEFVDKANKIHNFKYDYSLVDYQKGNIKVKIICPIHGEFEQTPDSHLQGCGCKFCKNLKLSLDRRSTKEVFIEKSNIVHNNLYDYSLVEYTNVQTKVNIICKKHGLFLQTPNHHLQGQGCPICKQSSGEKLVESILLKYDIKFSREVTFTSNEVIRNTKDFRIDFVIKKENYLYFIEYNGIQHYEPVNYFGGESAFILQQNRDKYIRGLVNRNKHKLKLLEISYKNTSSTVEQKIINFLNIKHAPNNVGKSDNIEENPVMDNIEIIN